MLFVWETRNQKLIAFLHFIYGFAFPENKPHLSICIWIYFPAVHDRTVSIYIFGLCVTSQFFFRNYQKWKDPMLVTLLVTNVSHSQNRLLNLGRFELKLVEKLWLTTYPTLDTYPTELLWWPMFMAVIKQTDSKVYGRTSNISHPGTNISFQLL